MILHDNTDGTRCCLPPQLDGLNFDLYCDVVLPRVMEQIISCKDDIAQQYLMQAVIQACGLTNPFLNPRLTTGCNPNPDPRPRPTADPNPNPNPNSDELSSRWG